MPDGLEFVEEVHRFLMPDVPKQRARQARYRASVKGKATESRYWASEAAKESKARMKENHPLFDTWGQIKQRCFNPKAINYQYYGGRGITVYPEWVESFAAFETWMDANLGPRPEGKSLDRIDNYGHYEPGNLRGATRQEQMANSRIAKRS